MVSKEKYINRTIRFLEYLDPEIVVQRLVARGSQDEVIFENWDQGWWKIKQEIESGLEKRNTYQGIHFDYLDGKALRFIEN